MTQSPTFFRFQLGHQLRQLRERAGVTTDEAGRHADCHGSNIRKIEAGRAGLKRPILMALLDLYQVTDAAHRETLAMLASQGHQRGWWARYRDLPQAYSQYIGLESAASQARTYGTLLVPGLLQTENYARAVILAGSPEESAGAVDLRVKVRMDRQELLHRENPLRLWAILDESVLHRRIGGPEVMREQLRRLLQAARLRNVTVQVLPFEGGAYAGMAGSFTLLSFDGVPDVAFVEGLTADMYVDDDDVKPYNVVFDNLRAAALSQKASIEAIEEALGGLPDE